MANDATRCLLILACSQRKRPDTELLPAIERYDGGSYRVLRKAQHEGYLSANLDILILSAKYGLIAASTPITDYQMRMTLQQAKAIREQTMEAFKAYTSSKNYQEFYIDLGQDYLPAIEGISKIISESPVMYAQGRIGQRQAQLKGWLIKRYLDSSNVTN